jgi:mRNA interferase MazF
MHLMVLGFDDLIIGKDDDFAGSGLMADSLIRLGFLAVLPRKNTWAVSALSPGNVTVVCCKD